MKNVPKEKAPRDSDSGSFGSGLDRPCPPVAPENTPGRGVIAPRVERGRACLARSLAAGTPVISGNLRGSRVGQKAGVSTRVKHPPVTQKFFLSPSHDPNHAHAAAASAG